MAVSMERPLTPVSISSSNSIAIVEEGDAKPSVWLVFVSKSKDLTTTAVNKAIEEYARVPKDATTNPVIIRLEFIMSEVPTPREPQQAALDLEQLQQHEEIPQDTYFETSFLW